MERIKTTRRRWLGASAGAAGLLLNPLRASAQWRPDQVVEFVVPAGAGGALDQVGRAMKQYVDEGRLASRAMIVSNKAGGNGKIAFDVLRQHAGDPHYLSVNTHGYITSYLTGSLDVLPHRAFTTLAVLQDEFLTLAVRADSPIARLSDAVDALRRDPGSLSIAVATSIGNHIHVGTAKALQAAGVDIGRLTVAPFRSSAESIVALVGGHIDLVAATTPNVITPLRAGSIRLLAVSADKRLGGAFAETPTWHESGYDTNFSSALGILAPAQLAREQVAFWENTCRQMVDSDLWRQLAERNQSRPRFLGAAEAAAFYERESVGLRETVRALGLLKEGR